MTVEVATYPPLPKTFDVEKKMINLASKDKLPRLYLPVQWRLVWFREVCPHGIIITQEMEIDHHLEQEAEVDVWNNEKRKTEKVLKKAKGYARFHARVEDGQGGVGEGTKAESKVHFADYGEKAETGAIGRALATLGYGTQFTDRDFLTGERLADAPVEKSEDSSSEKVAQKASAVAPPPEPAVAKVPVVTPAPTPAPTASTPPAKTPTPITAARTTVPIAKLGGASSGVKKDSILKSLKPYEAKHFITATKLPTDPAKWTSAQEEMAINELAIWLSEPAIQEQLQEFYSLANAFTRSQMMSFIQQRYNVLDEKTLTRDQIRSVIRDAASARYLRVFALVGAGDPDCAHLKSSFIPQGSPFTTPLYFYQACMTGEERKALDQALFDYKFWLSEHVDESKLGETELKTFINMKQNVKKAAAA